LLLLTGAYAISSAQRQGEMMPADETLIGIVRTGDYDRFLAIQLAPSVQRWALYALTAFSCELARIAESVQEPLAGHMRLAWWRESLEAIRAGAPPRQHPVLLALAELLSAQPALVPLLFTMIEARAADLDPELLATEAEWRQYLEDTAGALHEAWALVLDANALPAVRASVRAQAVAYAVTGLVRAIPHLAIHNLRRFSRERMDTLVLNNLQPSVALTKFVSSLIDEVNGLESLHSPNVLPKVFLPLRGLNGLAKFYRKQILNYAYDPYLLRVSKLAAVCRIVQMKFILY
jgi:hypothetical protein